MMVYGVSESDINEIVRAVSRELYRDNVIVKSSRDRSTSRGPRASFTLRVLDSGARAPGAIGDPRHTGHGPYGMRRNSLRACWHAHWDVIEELFRRFPDARVVAGYWKLDDKPVTYTAGTFRETALRTAHLNIGSQLQPMTMPECCECDHSRYADQPAYVTEPVPAHNVPPWERNAYGQSAYYEGDLSGYSHNHRHNSNPDPKRRYFLDGLAPAQPWTPRVKPGSATVGATLDEINSVLSEHIDQP